MQVAALHGHVEGCCDTTTDLRQHAMTSGLCGTIDSHLLMKITSVGVLCHHAASQAHAISGRGRCGTTGWGAQQPSKPAASEWATLSST